MEKLSPGKILMVQRQMSTNKYKCPVLGIRPPDFLLIELPNYGNAPIGMLCGDQCSVRFLSQGVIYGFQTAVAQVYYDPFPMMFVDYPKQFEEISVRRVQRLECHLPATVTPVEQEEPLSNGWGWDQTWKEHQSFIIDLGEGGLQVAIPTLPSEANPPTPPPVPQTHPETARPYPPEELNHFYQKDRVVSVRFVLPTIGPNQILLVDGRICWTLTTPEYFFFGLGFMDPSVEVLHSIQKVIREQDEFFSPKISSPRGG
ncbi:MAG TPA: flagellar brake protein [Candidatus Sumerlaeota bacterium]|mgnify:CR=1 FL=1|nr:flagellar brake protein [Candidatus Sumerlaeota bacterium]HPS01856.1 flagellar brake protein [Candidatus Sumerlaeota bacterium]